MEFYLQEWFMGFEEIDRKRQANEDRKRKEGLTSLIQAISFSNGQQKEATSNTESQSTKRKPSNPTPPAPLEESVNVSQFTKWKRDFVDYSCLIGLERFGQERQRALLRSCLDSRRVHRYSK